MIKLVFLSACVMACLAAPQYYNNYRPSLPQYRILDQRNNIYPDGSYDYAYDTENGISAQESGQQRLVGPNYGNVVQGSYRYTAPDGTLIQVQYTADENGFHPTGNVILGSPNYSRF